MYNVDAQYSYLLIIMCRNISSQSHSNSEVNYLTTYTVADGVSVVSKLITFALIHRDRHKYKYSIRNYLFLRMCCVNSSLNIMRNDTPFQMLWCIFRSIIVSCSSIYCFKSFNSMYRYTFGLERILELPRLIETLTLNELI